ncbi:MAG: hypothetical protein KDD58_10160 [Bdellovibrionales bacterium]|nr:hypothetical protein [Bdellovibrionales bacterium]
MKFFCYIYLLLAPFYLCWADESLLQKAKQELSLPKLNAQAANHKNQIVQVPIDTNKKKIYKKRSVSLLFGSHTNQTNVFHPRFNKAINKTFFDNALQVKLQPQYDIFELPTGKPTYLGLKLSFDYSQTKERYQMDSVYDDIRITNYKYGLGPSITTHFDFFKQNFSIAFNYIFAEKYTSISSASHAIKESIKENTKNLFANLKYYIGSTNFLELQNTFNEDESAWNIGFGTSF